MVEKVCRLLLLCSPIAYATGVSMVKLDIRLFEVGVVMLFAASLFDTAKRALGRMTALLVGSFCLLLAGNAMVNRFQPMDIRAVELCFLGVLAFVILVRHLSDVRGCRRALFVALGINLVVFFCQRLGYSPLVSISRDVAGGLMGNVAQLGIYLAVVMPLMPVPAMAALALLFGAGLVVDYLQWNVLIPIFIVFYFRYRSIFARIALAVAMLGAVAIFHTKVLESILLRWRIWQPTLELAFERPLLGWGFGTYALWHSAESFSLYLPLFYGFGALGLVWVGWCVRELLTGGTPTRERLAILSLSVLCLVEYPFDLPRLWFTLVFLLACAAIQRQEELTDAGRLSGA